MLLYSSSEHIKAHRTTEIYYTDGSKNTDGTAYAYHHRTHNQKTRISNYASIYTAELLAIKDVITKATITNTNKALILTDSLSAIDGINKMLNKHPIITQILDLIQQSSIELTICWVPSHSGIQGNEIADKLAKEAITIETITNISLPQNDIKAAFKTKVRNQWQTEWTNTNQNTTKLRSI